MSADSGWNSVIHHPSELELQNWDWGATDGEPERELPSTVDMNAIKDDGNWNPVSSVTTANSDDESDSEDDSSGESDGSCSYTDSNSETDNDSSEGDSESNSDCSSDHSEQTFSIRETNFEQGGLKLKISMKIPRKEDLDKLRYERGRRLLCRRTKSRAAKASDCSSEDSDSSYSHPNSQFSQDAAQQSEPGQESQSQSGSQQQQQQQPQPLQEINQEDLAAILPGNEDAPFDGFEDSESGPLVSKAIERMSLGVDSDSSEHVNGRNPVPVYSSSLLQQFVEKTALLSEPRKKRGGAKQQQSSVTVSKKPDAEYASASNVSPDSGIQSVNNSPLHVTNPASPPVTSTSANNVVSSSDGHVSQTIPSSSDEVPTSSTSDDLPSSSNSRSTPSKSSETTSNPINNTATMEIVDKPPKRKPGRPAKLVNSTTTQPRGPGRPKLNKSDPPPEEAEKASPNKDSPCLKRAKVVVSPCGKPTAKQVQHVEDSRSKARKPALRKSCCSETNVITTKPSPADSHQDGKSHARKKSSSKSDSKQQVAASKRSAKDATCTPSQSDEQSNCKRIRREKPTRKDVEPPTVKNTESVSENTGKLDGKKSSKENRVESANTSKRQPRGRKTSHQEQPQPQPVPPRRVLKENKVNKKVTNNNNSISNNRNSNDNDEEEDDEITSILQTNGVGVQTIISLPVINPMKSTSDYSAHRKSSSRRSPILQSSRREREILSLHHHHHHHHHHKHRRRFVAAPKQPIRVDPAVTQELERLIDEFTNLCTLGKMMIADNQGNASGGHHHNGSSSAALKQVGELLPQIFRLKKASKKRKGCELTLVNKHSNGKMKRRLKKDKASSSSSSASSTSGASIAESSNSNEQRLPLKKRHYHVFSALSSSQEARSQDVPEPSRVKGVVEAVPKKSEPRETVITHSKSEVADKTVTTTAAAESGPEKELKKKQSKEPTEKLADKTSSETDKAVSSKIQDDIESQPRRKKKIVKDLRVTVTKLPVANNHIVEKQIEKLEKLCAGDRTSRSTSDKIPTAEKLIPEKVLKVQNEKGDKPETRSSDRLERSARNKQRDEKESNLNKSKKDAECSKVGKREIETSKVSKKDAETINKIGKKDVESQKAVTKNTEVQKASKEEIDTSNTLPRDDSEDWELDTEVMQANKRELESIKKKDLNNKLDMIRNSEVVLLKTIMSETPTSDSSASTITMKKRIRRRKAINRTGFPTLKKKKKKLISDPLSCTEEVQSMIAKVDKKANSKPANVEVVKLKGDTKEVKDKESVKRKLELKEMCDGVNKYESKKVGPDRSINENENITLEEASQKCTGQLRIRNDLCVIECDGSRPCDKLCPVKYEKIQDSRMFDENATLEESLERCNQIQKVAILSEENVRKLECAISHVSVKLEAHGFFNNNNHRRGRGSASPCPLTVKNLKRLRNDYDTESDAIPSSDDHDKTGGSTTGRRKQPKWKKRYLQAGLFSDFFKEDEPRKVSSSDASKSKYVYDPAEHPHGLLPPPYHCGKFLRQRKIPFQLPYDLWWLHTHSRLPGRDLVPSWNYRKIRSNVYYDVKPIMLYEAQACECKPEAGCGDDCINRMVFSECSPQLCPCGDRCKNQKIQKHGWAPGLQRFMTDSKGWGVRTNQPIKTGEFILEYVGEVVSEREFKARMATRYANDTHHYCLHLDGGLVIDGHRMGGDGRFVNHSCEPNCEMQKWSVHGLPRMALFASRNIDAGEELTYDYNFALFNPSEGQECRCGSDECRGVIGGKSQRVARPSAPVNQSRGLENYDKRAGGRPRKNSRKANSSSVCQSPAKQSLNSTTTAVSDGKKSLCKKRRLGPDGKPLPAPTPKPMSHQQRCYVLQHRCFLVRNIEKIRKNKRPINQLGSQNKNVVKATGIMTAGIQASKEKSTNDGKATSEVFFTHLTALTSNGSRTVRTRRLAQAQDDPEVNKAAKLAKVLKDLHNVIMNAKDENKALLCTPFISLPPKRKLPEYYEKVHDPIDLNIIDQNIDNGQYKTAEQFDQDVIRMFDNYVRYHGRTSEVGIAAARLRKIYLGSKADFVLPITEATGIPPSQAFLPRRGSAGEEDVIRCICGLHRDEGLMIQCERCLVWQHCDCVKADTSADSYLCEHCQPRDVDYEIPLENEEEEEGKKHYVTLMRGDLQLRTGDTVYVLRDTPDKHTYKTIEKFDYEQMDIFRIERLWKNDKGERFVFGHHYLRPHETYHEPTRKFYENEVVCAPLYEAVPCDLVAGRCWVLDPHTFCKGRPANASPEHIYVCEYRVDRAARLFAKVAKSRHHVCTKPYAFDSFPQRIKHYRTYLPHSLDGVQLGGKSSKEKKKHGCETEYVSNKFESRDHSKASLKDKSHNLKSRKRLIKGAAVSKNSKFVQRVTKTNRLNNILLNLLNKMPNKEDPLDASNLLERNRRNRKRPVILSP
ncbi:hypothetical protein QAD02_006989 [Eretmocerus hayati]|uniref:Uncharacterized protein n=1 Tax=Eretmocerus hayati TaxID=131215 RepID=A0ACC2N2F4_9HYME|nr:hypothetical protein QAD02_006989 [Eretmocerus hayati]